MRRTYQVPSGLVSAAPPEGPRLSVLEEALDALSEHPSRLGLDGLEREEVDSPGSITVDADPDILDTARLYAILFGRPQPWAGDLSAEAARLQPDAPALQRTMAPLSPTM